MMISRAVVLKNGKILLIHRFCDRDEYYVLPGGHIEENETEEDTLIRELKEETGLDIHIDKKLWDLENPKDRSKHHFFLVTKFSGELVLGGPESEKDSEKDKYILEWHKIEEIPDLKLVPESLKKKIIEMFLGI